MPIYPQTMNPVIVFRDDVDWRQEKDSAAKHFPCHKSRCLVKPGDTVIARFSALPFYKEQEFDYSYLGATMINSHQEHLYIADLQNWYMDLSWCSPKTYTELYQLPDNGPFFLKGETNSKKFLWKTHAFAQTKKDAIDVYGRLTEDSMLQYQKIYIREFVKLKTYMTGLQDLPITKEFRCFFYKKQLLSVGYYWASHIEELNEMGINPDANDIPKAFLDKIADIVSENTNYYVVDVAETATGDWIVIELNDGQMSGLSCNDPDTLYTNLKLAIS